MSHIPELRGGAREVPWIGEVVFCKSGKHALEDDAGVEGVEDCKKHEAVLQE